MRYGFSLNAAQTAESILEVALAAEEHGWDGLFLADAIGIETPDYPAFPFFDPWVLAGGIAARTPEEFAAALARLRDDPELAAELGRRGRAFAARRYAAPLLAERLVRLVKTHLLPS